jgi:Viral BACON domain/PKD domain
VPDNNAASLQVVRRLRAVASIPSRTPGQYSIRLLSRGGVVLAGYPFTPEAVEDAAGLLSFYQVVDAVPGAAAVQIVRLADGVVLGSYPLSANPPTISGVTLAKPPNPVIGTVTLSWKAGDPDGGALSFDLSYSRDGGLTFMPLRFGVKGTSTQVDTGPLGGSASAVFRVTASDGANLASADSAPFVMAAKPPVVRILNPQDGLHIQHGQIINLEAEADDAQDGSEVTYSWKTQGGTFGSGDRVTVGILAIGANTITVTATNSHGQSASDSIKVYVGDDLNLPGPTLSAGPSRLSFHAGAGASTKQSAEISIGNTGSGQLNWSASTDAAWLSLNAASGSAPATLIATVNPSGLKAGRSYTANVTIRSTAAGSPATIPVALSIGDTWSGPAARRRLFLPMVARR